MCCPVSVHDLLRMPVYSHARKVVPAHVTSMPLWARTALPWVCCVRVWLRVATISTLTHAQFATSHILILQCIDPAKLRYIQKPILPTAAKKFHRQESAWDGTACLLNTSVSKKMRTVSYGTGAWYWHKPCSNPHAVLAACCAVVKCTYCTITLHVKDGYH